MILQIVARYHMQTLTVLTADATIPTGEPVGTSVTYNVQRGSNAVTLMLTKGNPTPDGWSVAANGVMRAGTF